MGAEAKAMRCAMVDQGWEIGDCLVEMPACGERSRTKGRREQACRATLREEDGSFSRLIESAHLSRPEHYFSIYQSGCNHSCRKCHSWEFSQRYSGTWYTTDQIADMARAYERHVTVWEPRERATIDFLNELLEGRYIHLEKSLRASTRRSMGHRPPLTREAFLPEAPPPRIEGIPTIAVPLPELEEPETVPETIEILEEPDAVPETLFYVRTLTPNDVLKALRQRMGTWEPDLGLEARDEHPHFWGWPDKYRAVHAERMEWRTSASFHSCILPEGTIQELCIWFRPERPGHPAEHRFRPATSVKALVIPPEFDINSLMVVQWLPEGSDAVFRVDFILPDDPEYGDYARYLTIRKPRHRCGYGSISDVEE